MKKKGKIHQWNTTRGMGLIRSPRTGHDIFFHIKDYRGSTAPREGETVWFDEVTSRHSRPRAIEVSTVSGNADVHSNRPRRYIGRRSNTRSFVLLLFLWVVLGAWGVWSYRLPLWLMAAVLAVNVLTVLLYARDPQGTRNRGWRPSESLLHLLSLLGGWPGAGLAQTILRYRSHKPSFATRYWGTVALHFAMLLGWLFWLQAQLAGY
ncbi:DUF1294 domain-containing protein [Rhodoferax sp. WC2427]|uniref:DUF1294 domain-containing protein n=1 Tax=Rhodoferax sp. WC2427 TaxID=3234144 RepID=UPI0034662BBE